MIGFTWFVLGVLTVVSGHLLWEFSRKNRLHWLLWTGLILGLVSILFSIAWAVGSILEGVPRAASMGLLMFGLGGIFTEILKDISFRVAPIEKRDAKEMMQEIKGHKILENVRGMPAADLEELSEILIRVGEIGLDNDAIKEIDVNPLILSGSQPVAVDALVVLNPPG